MTTEFKITKRLGIENEVGFSGYITVGGQEVPVTYHEVFDLEGRFWVCSDASTGCLMASGETRAKAKKEALARIARIGAPLFFEARKKFQEIAYNGKTISEFTGKIVSQAKTKKYNAWAQRMKRLTTLTINPNPLESRA